MKVKERMYLGDGHMIEFGTSTWDDKVLSVRNRYPTANGGFNPRSSSEIPLKDLKTLLIGSITYGYLSQEDVRDILKVCENSMDK